MRLWIGLALLGGLLVLAGGNGGSDRTTEDPTSLAKQDKDKDVKEKKDPSKKDTIQEYVQSVIKGRSSAHKGSEAKKKESIKAKVERTIDENGDDLLKDARRQAMEKDKAPFKESPSLLSMNALDAVLQETGFNSLRAFDKAVAPGRNRDNYNMMSWLSVDTLKKLADYRTAIKEELD